VPLEFGDRPPAATRGLCWQPVQGWEDDRCDLCRGGQNKSEKFHRQQMACPIACFICFQMSQTDFEKAFRASSSLPDMGTSIQVRQQ